MTRTERVRTADGPLRGRALDVIRRNPPPYEGRPLPGLRISHVVDLPPRRGEAAWPWRDLGRDDLTSVVLAERTEASVDGLLRRYG
ncbi:hypothetical protein [Streptomyces sp. YKOK-I1]